MLPHYIFLPSGAFVIALIDEQASEAKLLYPFNTEQQFQIKGQFATALIQALKQSKGVDTSALVIVEKQCPWLEGLSQASFSPISYQNMVIGDALGLLFLEITDQCNEQCIHCYASSSPACSEFLSLQEIKHVLEQAIHLGTPFVQFTGGDPLIHRHLVEAVACAHELGFEGIEIYTNGLLLNDKLLEKFLPYQPLLAFSLYSPDEGVHDGITQVKGSWKKTVAAMHRAQDMAFQVRIGMAVMQQNEGHEKAMLDFVKAEFGLGKEKIRFDPVHETGRGSQLNTKHISLMPSQNSHMPDQKSKPQEHHQVIQQDKSKTSIPSNEMKIYRRGKLAVCANGDVSPCIFNREHVLGNIKQQSLQDMLAGPYQGQDNKMPSIERWNQCQEKLSCSDCQMVAYNLGEGS
jgi:MoaA/NifB/PqqE/SkfB family radical SAM enzyme